MRKKERKLIPCECTNPDCHEMIWNYDKWGKPRRFKNGHYAYKDGRRSSHGYVFILFKGHQRADKRGYVREHILVFEEYHSCCVLEPKLAAIHHINKKPWDNRPENLEGMSPRQHTILHMKGHTYNKSKKHTEESKLKISRAKLGKYPSEETKLKMSQSKINYWLLQNKTEIVNVLFQIIIANNNTR
jgi:HNH endonuclease/NUMOD3 motif